MLIPLTARRTVAFTPPSLADRRPQPTLRLRVPTMFDKDTFYAELVRRGFRLHDVDALRAMMRHALETLQSPERYEQSRTFLEEVWQREAARSEAEALRLVRVALRAANGEEPEPEDVDPLPPALTEAEAARYEALDAEIRRCWPPFRKALADNIKAGPITDYALVQLFVVEWSGLDVPPAAPDDDEGLPFETVERLRDALGAAAFGEVAKRLSDLMSVGEVTGKESASPSASGSDPNGSSPPATETSTDGSMTASSGDALPAG